MSTQALMVTPTTGLRIQRGAVRPSTPRTAPGRLPARRAPRVLGPRTGAVRRSGRPLGVPAPELRHGSRVVAAPRPVADAHAADWRLTDRGLAVVMAVGGLLVTLALVAIVATFFAVTAEVPSMAPFAQLG